MSEEQRNALVRRSPGGVEKIGSGASNILSGMISDALVLARCQEKPLAGARFRVGHYEFRSPDYRQILLWADLLKIEPIMVIQRLEGEEGLFCFRVDDGAIISLTWNFESLPLASFEWLEGLSICDIAYKGSLGLPIDDLSLHLPSLQQLFVAGVKLKALDLSAVGKLLWLDCSNNQLTELDLSHVPELTELYCESNRLTEIDLSSTPELEVLNCSRNQLHALDLSSVPKLTELNCSGISAQLARIMQRFDLCAVQGAVFG